MTTIKLFGGDLGGETMLVACDLSNASARVEVNYEGDGDDWSPTQYQCADTRHRVGGLVRIAKELAASAVEMPRDEFDCEWEEVD